MPFQVWKPVPRRGHLQLPVADIKAGIEIDAAVALNSLVATGAAAAPRPEAPQVEKKGPPDKQNGPVTRPNNVNSGAIKLTEATMARLSIMLRSGCSIQLACDDVRRAQYCEIHNMCSFACVPCHTLNPALSTDWRVPDIVLSLGGTRSHGRRPVHIL